MTVKSPTDRAALSDLTALMEMCDRKFLFAISVSDGEDLLPCCLVCEYCVSERPVASSSGQNAYGRFCKSERLLALLLSVSACVHVLLSVCCLLSSAAT